MRLAPRRTRVVVRASFLVALAVAVCSAALTGSAAVWVLAVAVAVGAAYLSADGHVHRVRSEPFEHPGTRAPEQYPARRTTGS